MATKKVRDFRKLYEKVASEPILKSVGNIDQRVGSIAKMEKSSIEEVNLALKSLGDELANKLSDEMRKGARPVITPDFRKLLVFLSKASETQTQYLECKDPLPESTISFEDIVGLEDVKNAMKTGYILPFKFPGLFPTVVKGILL